jgi:hypothetical protein
VAISWAPFYTLFFHVMPRAYVLTLDDSNERLYL